MSIKREADNISWSQMPNKGQAPKILDPTFPILKHHNSLYMTFNVINLLSPNPLPQNLVLLLDILIVMSFYLRPRWGESYSTVKEEKYVIALPLVKFECMFCLFLVSLTLDTMFSLLPVTCLTHTHPHTLGPTNLNCSASPLIHTHLFFC